MKNNFILGLLAISLFACKKEETTTDSETTPVEEEVKEDLKSFDISKYRIKEIKEDFDDGDPYYTKFVYDGDKVDSIYTEDSDLNMVHSIVFNYSADSTYFTSYDYSAGVRTKILKKGFYVWNGDLLIKRVDSAIVDLYRDFEPSEKVTILQYEANYIYNSGVLETSTHLGDLHFYSGDIYEMPDYDEYWFESINYNYVDGVLSSKDYYEDEAQTIKSGRSIISFDSTTELYKYVYSLDGSSSPFYETILTSSKYTVKDHEYDEEYTYDFVLDEELGYYSLTDLSYDAPETMTFYFEELSGNGDALYFGPEQFGNYLLLDYGADFIW